MAMKKIEAPDPVDIHVGKMIRARRLAIGISQVELSEALGTSFQQVQKYERGANRISASKLLATARKLGTTVAAFFEGLDAEGETQTVMSEFADFLELEGAAPMARAYLQLTPVQRRRLLELTEVINRPS
jgi:transcriptional regulator with XRE-family HTH domain